MNEQNELVKPEGVTQEEWDAAGPEMRELMVEEAAGNIQLPQPAATPQPQPPNQSPDAVTPAAAEDPANDPQHRQPVAPQAGEAENGRSAHEIANAASKGQDVFPGEDGEVDKDVDPARVATAGP